MGYYLNPKDGQEEWLSNNATRASLSEVQNFDFSPERVLLCLVDNYDFTALGVAYDRAERETFLETHSGRPKKWFIASKTVVLREMKFNPWKEVP